MYLWKKKIGDIHISSKDTTLCGKPMLGNNYADQKVDKPTCEECISENEWTEDEKEQLLLEKSLFSK